MSYLDIVHRRNLYEIAELDEQLRRDQATSLLQFYKGRHRSEIEALIDELMTSPRLRAKYKALIAQWNILRKVVHEVTVVGREDVEVAWQDAEPSSEGADDGAAAGSASQNAWDEWAGSARFTQALRTFFRFAELLGTVLVQPLWDERANRVFLRLLTPDLVRVFHAQGTLDATRPAMYVLETDQQRGVCEVWDVEERRYWREDSKGRVVGEVEDIAPELDDPFVAIRTGYPVGEFWYDDSSETLLVIQRQIDYLLTQLWVQLYYGQQFPIIEGAPPDPTPYRTADDGEAPDVLSTGEHFVFDVSEITYTGINAQQQPRALRFDGPDLAAVFEPAMRMIQTDVGQLEAAYGFPPGAFQIEAASAQSGISIKLKHAPLQDKYEADARLYGPTLRDLVAKVVVVWRLHGSGAPSGEFTVRIPAPEFAAVKEEELADAKERMQLGLMRPFEVVQLVHPDFDDDDVAEYLRKIAEEWELLRIVKQAMSTSRPYVPAIGASPFAEDQLEGGGEAEGEE